jgi:hypothetical protein
MSLLLGILIALYFGARYGIWGLMIILLICGLSLL